MGAKSTLSDVARPSAFEANRFKIVGGCARRTKSTQLASYHLVRSHKNIVGKDLRANLLSDFWAPLLYTFYSRVPASTRAVHIPFYYTQIAVIREA